MEELRAPAVGGQPDGEEQVSGLADEALQDLARHLRETATALEVLARRAQALHESRLAGTPWHDLVQTEDRPLIVEQLASVLDGLGTGSARFRRAEALALAAHGLSHRSIAALFGVTRQRVGALLSPPPGTTDGRPTAP